MKERRKYRNFLVSYDEERCISWRTEEELQELMEEERVDWYLIEDKKGEIKRFKLKNERNR